MRLGSSLTAGATARVLQFDDDSEQRWIEAPPLVRRTLELGHINAYDLANVIEFWRSMKGRFDATWDITIGGRTERNLAFADDTLNIEQTLPGRFNLTLKLMQTLAA